MDLDYESFAQLRPLKIIATDILQMRPVLFDRIRTPEVPIGDAVAASIAIPIVFRPVTVRGLPNEVGQALFVDGGLVSNLPFWVFGEEKMAVERANPADPPVPIVAFTLVDREAAPKQSGPGSETWGQVGFYSKAAFNGALLGLGIALIGSVAWSLATGVEHLGLAVDVGIASGAVFNFWRTRRAYLKATAGNTPPSFLQFLAQSVRTGIFGSQAVAQNLLRDVVQVPLITRLTVLGFERPWLDIRADYVSGRQSATRKLCITFFQKPMFLDERLREAVDLAREQLNKIRNLRGRQPVGQLRAYVLEPFGGQSLRVTHGHNMDGDADDRLTLDRRGPGAGEAFKSGDVVVMSFAPGWAPPFMTKYDRALLRPQLRSAVCIPIFRDIEAWGLPLSDRPPPLGVLAIDSDDDLSEEFAERGFIDAMAEPTVLISPAFEME
jgi:hypothetical protein